MCNSCNAVWYSNALKRLAVGKSTAADDKYSVRDRDRRKLFASIERSAEYPCHAIFQHDLFDVCAIIECILVYGLDTSGDSYRAFDIRAVSECRLSDICQCARQLQRSNTAICKSMVVYHLKSFVKSQVFKLTAHTECMRADLFNTARDIYAFEVSAPVESIVTYPGKSVRQ